MKLIRAQTFAKRYFGPEDEPDLRTVRSWVGNGTVPGRIVGVIAYVDAEAWEKSTGNALADRIMGKAA